MDPIDEKIIRILQENARISTKDLAERIQLSAPAAAERIRRLEENRIITGYSALIDSQKVGKTVMAMINISIKVSKQKEFVEVARQDSAVVSCHHVTGSYSMIMKVVVREIPELDRIIDKYQKYGDTQTQIVLSSPIDDIIRL